MLKPGGYVECNFGKRGRIKETFVGGVPPHEMRTTGTWIVVEWHNGNVEEFHHLMVRGLNLIDGHWDIRVVAPTPEEIGKEMDAGEWVDAPERVPPQTVSFQASPLMAKIICEFAKRQDKAVPDLVRGWIRDRILEERKKIKGE